MLQKTAVLLVIPGISIPVEGATLDTGCGVIGEAGVGDIGLQGIFCGSEVLLSDGDAMAVVAVAGGMSYFCS